jgi:hypothetical protein
MMRCSHEGANCILIDCIQIDGFGRREPNNGILPFDEISLTYFADTVYIHGRLSIPDVWSTWF